MIESILNDAVKYSREIINAKAGNKYYFDMDLVKEKGSVKLSLYNPEIKQGVHDRYEYSRKLVDDSIEDSKEEINYLKGKIKECNSVYKDFYQAIMYGGKIDEKSTKQRNDIRNKFYEKALYEKLFNDEKSEMTTSAYEKLYNYEVRESKRHLITGTCPDYSNNAFHYLMHQRVDDILKFFSTGLINNKHVYIQIVCTEGIYDHVFMTIGSFDNNMFKPMLGRLYHELPIDLWVCDPWANIVCRSDKYNDLWKNKMNKWHYVGKCLELKMRVIPKGEKAPPSAESSSPIKRDTYLTIQNSVKKVIGLGVISPDKRITIQALSKEELQRKKKKSPEA
ncbi:hypothetical protein [Xenorhabdus bharatensis]|uniref:hypothetical protein n=1 Tax=Xenorhabdus bharatensis TaxID=3136256 RepID=UPI0030F3D380